MTQFFIQNQRKNNHSRCIVKIVYFTVEKIQAYCVEHIDLAFDTCKSISLKKKDSWKRSEKKS